MSSPVYKIPAIISVCYYSVYKQQLVRENNNWSEKTTIGQRKQQLVRENNKIASLAFIMSGHNKERMIFVFRL